MRQDGGCRVSPKSYMAISTTAQSSQRPVRLILAHHYPISLLGLERILADEKRVMTVVGKTSNTLDAFNLALKNSADIILLRVDQTPGKKEAVVTAIAKSKVSVVLLGSPHDHSADDDAILAGAKGLIGIDSAPKVYVKAIQKVYAGEVWMDRATTARIFMKACSDGKSDDADLGAQAVASLTARERQIVLASGANPGATISELANTLHISERTFSNHLTAIYSKLGVRNRLDLYLFASKHSSLRS